MPVVYLSTFDGHCHFRSSFLSLSDLFGWHRNIIGNNRLTSQKTYDCCGQTTRCRHQVTSWKCVLFQKSVTYLGHVVFEAGIARTQKKIRAVKPWPLLTSTRELHGFMGLAGCLLNPMSLFWIQMLRSGPLDVCFRKGKKGKKSDNLCDELLSWPPRSQLLNHS